MADNYGNVGNNCIHLDVSAYMENLYKELKNIPFYKTERGYQYAAYLLDDPQKSMYAKALLDGDPNGAGLDERSGQKLKKDLQDTVETLTSILISDDDLNKWITFQEECGGVKAYHQCLEKFQDSIVCLSLEKLLNLDDTESENRSDEYFQYSTGEVLYADIAKIWEEENIATQKCANGMVLNHNNPFADISIEEQSFIYGSNYGQFERIGLTTSHTMTKVAKDTEKSYLVLQPGFKIKKLKNTAGTKNADVLFDDTFTTELTQTDTNVYVYID